MKLADSESDALVAFIVDASVMPDGSDTVSYDANITLGEPDAMPQPTTGTLYSYPVPNGVAINLDGMLGSGWQPSSFVEFAIAEAEQTIAIEDTYVADASVRFASMYDNEKIYFFLEVHDSLIVNNSTYAYNDDSIELYFDGLNNRDGPFGSDDFFIAMGTDGSYATGTNSINIQGFARITPGGYNLELAFSRSDFGNPANTTLGFNIGINDDDNIGDHQIDAYGLWHLPSTPVCTTCCSDQSGNYAWCDTTRLGQLVLMP